MSDPINRVNQNAPYQYPQSVAEQEGVAGTAAVDTGIQPQQGLDALGEGPSQTQLYASQDIPLPDVEGQMLPLGDDNAATANWAGSPPMSYLAALTQLINQANEKQQMQGELHTSSTLMNSTMARAAGEKEKDKVKGERQQTIGQVITGAVALVVGVGTAGLGAKWQNNPMGKDINKTLQRGAMASAGGMAASQLINQLGTAIDKNASFGGQYKADEAKIAQKFIEVLQQMYKANEDMYTSSYQNSQKAVDELKDFLKNHWNDVFQTSRNIAQNV